MIRPREKEATWGVAAVAWFCGWLAAQRLSWDAFVVAGGAVCYLGMLECLGIDRFPAIFLAHHRKRLAAGLALSGLLMLFLAWMISRLPDASWIMAVVMPSMLYGAARVASLAKLEVFAFLGLASLTSIAPVTYLTVAGVPSARLAAAIWGCFGAYATLSALLLRAKVGGSRIALWAARLGSIVFLAGSVLVLRAWPSLPRVLVTAVFLVAALRVWGYRPDRPVNLTRLESKELSYDALAALAIDAAILMA